MGIYQVTLLQNLLAESVRNTFYYEDVGGTFVPSEWIDVCDEIRGYFATHLQSTFVNDWAFFGIEHRFVSVAGYPSFTVYPTAGALLGSNVNDSVATQVAMVASVKGPTTKPNRGRSFLAGWNEGNLTNSLWSSGAVASAAAFILAMDELNALGTFALKRVAAQWNTTHTAVVDSNQLGTLAIQVASIPGTLRSRRLGKGV